MTNVSPHAPKTVEAWAFVQKMIGDITNIVAADAENERELIEGLGVVSRVTALCSELTVEADPDLPWFFDMCSPTRLVGGPNPDGRYLLAMIRGDRSYRVTGTRGTTAYLGVQVLAGTGMTPRRMAAYVSDTDLTLNDGGFALVFSATEPVSGRARRSAVGADPGGCDVDRRPRVHRRRRRRALRDAAHRPPRPPNPPQPITDDEAAEQFTAMAWTIMKLTTLHRTIKPELLDAAQHPRHRGGRRSRVRADTTPDNLYMIGTFRLATDESLVLEFEPPDTRYWNVTLENIWHECLEPRRRHSSVTNKGVTPDADGVVRIAIGANDFGHGHWLDTGGRHRGFVVLRWLDNPDPPKVSVEVRSGQAKRVSAADRFDPAALIEQAREWAGSDDFGTDLDENETWRDGLGLLCDGFVEEARLNDLGVEIAALDVVRALKNRLQIVDWRKAHPEIAEEKIERPIFIVGQPRTGTTILFDLLAQDPGAAAAADMGGRRPAAGAAARDV